MRVYLFWALLFVCSCSTSDKRNCCEIEVPEGESGKEILLSSFVDNYQVIPLETADNHFVV